MQETDSGKKTGMRAERERERGGGKGSRMESNEKGQPVLSASASETEVH